MLVIETAHGRHIVVQTNPAELSLVRADGFAATSEVRICTDLPDAFPNPDRADPVVETYVPQGRHRSVDSDTVTVEIRMLEQLNGSAASAIMPVVIAAICARRA